MLYQLGRYEEALADIEKAVKFRGNDNDKKGKETVLKKIEERQKTQPRNPESYEQRLTVVEKYIKEHPQNADYWAEKGDILVRLKRHEEALSILDTAISLNPNLAMAWARKSWALYELKRNNDALIAIDKAIQLRPNTPQYLKGRKIITDSMEGRFATKEEIEALTREQ